MQQEAEERTVGLMVQSTKMSASLFMRAIQYYLRKQETYKEKNMSHTSKKVRIKDIIKDNAGVSNVEIQDKSVKQFERLARKNGVTYAIKKDKATEPPTFYIFFRSKDAEMIEYTLKEFTKKQLGKTKEPIIKQKIRKFMELSHAMAAKTGKIRKKEMVR